MASEIIKVPDIGADEAEVIELCVAAGDIIEAEDSIVVLESDKASMEVPAPRGGKVLAVLVKEGDTIKQGDDLFELEAADDSAPEEEPAPKAEADAAQNEEKTEEKPAAAAKASNTAVASEYPINVPDIGADEADVIEIMVSVGDEISKEDSLIVLESDKASMEVPSPVSGKVLSISIKEGDTAKQGDLILTLESTEAVEAEAEPAKEPEALTPTADAQQRISEPEQVSKTYKPVTGMTESRPTGEVYAGPAVRKMAREIGVDLATVPGSGPRGRITKDDVKGFIRSALKNKTSGGGAVSQGSGIPAVPEVDFAQFGDVTIEKMSKMHKVTAANMHRSWLNVPHVTGFDEFDISDLEEFRNSLKPEAERAGVKITPLPFLLKACAQALKAHPIINSSLHHDGESIVYKNYVHIGFAVDTPAGLMVPVIRDVDKKSLFELAAETAELAQLAKERKLKPAQMQGGTFTISSLGPMGGTGFTPIVNAPEVAILGVSKLDVKPRWNGKEFEPRKMLPVSLSYDHRAVNGGDAGRFLMMLNALLTDLRRMVL